MSDPKGERCETCNGAGRVLGLSVGGGERFFDCEDCKGTGLKLTPEQLAELLETQRQRGRR